METWTTGSRNRDMTLGSAPAITTARDAWVSGSCFKTSRIEKGWSSGLHDGSRNRDGSLPGRPMTPDRRRRCRNWRVPLGEEPCHICHLRIGGTTFVGLRHPEARQGHEPRSRYRPHCLRRSRCGIREVPGIQRATMHRSRDVLEERSAQSARTCACRVQLGPK